MVHLRHKSPDFYQPSDKIGKYFFFFHSYIIHSVRILNFALCYLFAMKYRLIAFVFFCLHMSAYTQVSSLVTDSISIRINQIASLHKSGEIERAQLEVEDLRWYVRRERSYFPEKAITTILTVYQSNKDEKSADKFLDEVNGSLAGIKNREARAAITAQLIKVFESRGATDKALNLQKLLTADSAEISAKSVNMRMDSLRKTSDSLSVIRQLELAQQDQYFTLDKKRASILGVASLLGFFALLAAHFTQRNRFRQVNKEKDIEIELLKGELYSTQHQLPKQRETNDPDPYIPPPKQQIVSTEPPTHIPTLASGQGQYYQPKYLALIVEPNRQIAMYLKSLLGAEFEIETAETFSEAWTVATEQIPDIVLCDSILNNGPTGIDLCRQIKQGQKTGHIPIVLISGKTNQASIEEQERASADLVLPRPILDEELDTQIASIFKSRKTAQQDLDHSLQLYFSKSRPEINDVFIKTMLQFIERNIPDASFTPTDLAKLMQYDNHVFCRKVLALTGKEPQDIIKILRMEKAKFLLENRAAPVQVVAGLVGYDNQGAFTRSFKEHFGDTTMLLLNA
jgi:CheY-like chemotaxis protein